MSKYLQIKNQILKLQKEAESLRQKERSETLARIKIAIDAFEFTAEELGFQSRPSQSKQKIAIKIEKPKKMRGSKAPPSSGKNDMRSLVAPKFRNAETGVTWAGRGKQPRWLVTELSRGKTLEDFKV